MTKKIKIYLGLIIFIAGILFFSPALAQTALPAGGSNFDTAKLIQPGKYQAELAPQVENYYSIQVKAGQEINIKSAFPPDARVELNLYDENKEDLLTLGPWLPGSQKSIYTYYLRVFNDWEEEPVSGTLEISLTNRYDANSGTDASDSFDTALSITPGNYQGYFSGQGALSVWGTDDKDIYQLSVQKGTTYEFKLTPSAKEEMSLALYGLDRQEIQEESSANAGAMVTLSLTPVSDTKVFLAVERPYITNTQIPGYKLDIKSSVPLIKFYICKGEKCESAGEYVSKADCEKAMAKTCYQTENCDGKCGVPPPVECAKDSDCPAGKICQDKKCVEKPVPPQKCSKDSDCPTGNVCKDGKCVLAPECTKDADCPTGMICKEGLCLFPILKCTKDSDCPAGKICQDKKCVEKPVLCVKDSDCLTGQVCKNGKCETVIPPVGCVKDSDCPTGNVCKDGKCVVSPLPPPGPGLTEKLLSIFKNLNWLYIGIIAGLVVLAIIVLILFLRKKPEKKENIPPATFSGSKEADKPTVGYKHPCKYCDKLIPPNSTVCPFCGKINPLGPYRCPKCHEPVQKDWQTCSRCGQNLRIVCPKCGKVTFFGDYCEDCGARLLVTCPHCGQEQPPLGDKCIKCNKPLEI